MINLIFVIFVNLFRAPFHLWRAHKMSFHPERYTDEERYAVAIRIVKIMNKTGKFKTIPYGLENLPKEGGYIMFPNHQGKFDVSAIVEYHERPCSFVMDREKSYTVLVREVVDLVRGKRLEINNPRQGIKIITEVIDEVKKGHPYILFPEGGYKFNNKNIMQEFKPGSFKIAIKSKCPIIPVVLVDSYKVFNSFHIGPSTVEVHYLEPIYYEEYKDMNTIELANHVQGIIQDKLNERLAAKDH